MSHPRIGLLVWDAWNQEHLQKHAVTPDEAVEVVMGDSLINETYKNRLMVIGPNTAERVLTVVIGQVPGADHVWYVFSARPASRLERVRYSQWKGGRQS